MGILVNQVVKRFVSRGREVLALDGVSLSIDSGQFVAFVGPSGCGKSTLLNMIAGILQPSAGEIIHDDQRVSGINRQIGYMTQVDNLLPWRTVEQNIRLPLEIQRRDRRETRERVEMLLDMVNLSGFAKHFPVELSGGMRKRVAIAQLLAYDPGTFLLDEPFGALDAQLKLIMQSELMKIWERTGKTVVFVNHDLAEAVALAQRVVVFSGRPGRIKHIEDVELPASRDMFKIRFEKAFQAQYERLWAELAPEISKGESL